MQARGASRTAVHSAMCRAVHNLIDDEPKILVDPFARSFAGHSSDEGLLKAYKSLALANIPWFRTQFVLRSRLAEDELAESVSAGLNQYIILGAGLDSFAYRRRDLMRMLDIYEVDHPVSQTWKRERVTELGLEAPATLHYAPIDFEQETRTDGLIAAGINRKEPAFFSWLGVTQYLTRDAVLRTLREIAIICPAGSTLVIQFVGPASSMSDEECALVTALAAATARLGEPWLSFFTSADMEEHLIQAGFSSVEHFGPGEASARYLLGRKDGLCLPGFFRIVKATIG